MDTDTLTPPPGFVLDAPPPPKGYVLDSPETPPVPPDGFVLDKPAEEESPSLRPSLNVVPRGTKNTRMGTFDAINDAPRQDYSGEKPPMVKAGEAAMRVAQAADDSEQSGRQDAVLAVGEYGARAFDIFGALNSVGKVAGGFINDLVQGNVLPDNQRILPNLSNTSAAMAGKEQPDKPQGIVQEIAVETAHMLPMLAVSTFLSAAGVPAPVAFGVPMAGTTFSETGDPAAAAKSGVLGAMMPGVGARGAVVGEEAAQRLAIKANLNPKAMGVIGKVIGSQSLLTALMVGADSDELVMLSNENPGEAKHRLIKIVAQNLAFEIPHLSGKVREGMAGDLVDQYLKSQDYKSAIDDTAFRLAKAIRPEDKSFKESPKPLEILANKIEPVAPLTAEALRGTAEKEVVAPEAETVISETVPPEIPLVEKPPKTGEGDVNSGALGESGMGAAKPTEFKEPEPVENPSSLKNSFTDSERKALGLEDRTPVEKVGSDAVLADAQRRMEENPQLEQNLIDELEKNPSKSIDRWEAVVLLKHKVDLEKQYNAALRRSVEAIESGDQNAKDAAFDDVEQLQEKLNRIIEISETVGTTAGRNLEWRKRMMSEDYKLSTEALNMARIKGDKLTPDELTRLSNQIDEYSAARDAAEKEAQKLDSEMADAALTESHKEAVDEVSKEPSNGSYSPRVLEVAKQWVERWNKEADSAMSRLMSKTRSGLSPKDVQDIAVVMRANIAELGLNFADMSVKLVGILGKGVEPYLKSAWDKANEMIDSLAAEPRVKRAIRKTKSDGDRDVKSETQAIKDHIKDVVENDGAKIGDLTNTTRSLQKSLIREGMHDRDEVVTEIHRIVNESLPEVTRKEVEDSLTGYGKSRRQNQDPIEKEARDQRNQLLIIRKLQESLARKSALKTGLVRDELSQEALRLNKLLSEYKRRYGADIKDSNPENIKSALSAKLTRQRNRIMDLKHENATRKRIVSEKTPSPESHETIQNKLEIERLTSENKEIFKEQDATKKAALAEKHAQRSLDEWEQRAKDARSGKFKDPSTKEKFTNEKIKAIEAQRDAYKLEVEELKALSPDAVSEKESARAESEKKAIEKQIADLEEKISTGDTSEKGNRVNRPHPTLEPLLQERDALRKRLADSRKKPESEKESEAMQKRLESLNSQINERQAKLDAGDLSSNTSPRQINRPLPNAELETARQQLDEINQQIYEARKSAKPKPSADELYVTRRLAHIARQEAAVRDKIARKDYSKRTPKPTPTLSVKQQESLIKAQIRLQDAKTAIERDKAKFAYDNLTKWGLAKHFAGETLNLQQNIKSSMDFSGFRQLAAHVFQTIGNIPIAIFKGDYLNSPQANLLREAGKGGQSLWSQIKFREHDQALRNRPNYRDGTYKLMKLNLSDEFHKDESIKGNWGNRLPGVRGSNRGFSMLLNEARANYADLLWQSSNKTPEAARAIGKLVNTFTGTVKLEPGFAADAARAASKVIWTPKMLISRLNLIRLAGTYGKDTKGTRLMALKQYAELGLGIYAVYSLASLAGFKKDKKGKLLDPESQTHVDLLGGVLQPLNLGKDVGAKILDNKSDDAWKTVGRFIRSKERPGVGMVHDFVLGRKKGDTLSSNPFGRNFIGEIKTSGDFANDLLAPMGWDTKDLMKLYESNGVPKTVAYQIINLLGGSVGVWEEDRARR